MKKICVLFFINIIFPAFGEIISDFSNICGADGRYHIIYAKPKSFDCAIGTFLPANGHICTNCPDGYTCAGGIYTYNPTKAQGIVKNANNPYISSNTHNTCSSNLGHIMHATRTANTINLDWYNGNETVAQTSCTYGETIQLPSNPTKPGYTFVGWRLKTIE